MRIEKGNMTSNEMIFPKKYGTYTLFFSIKISLDIDGVDSFAAEHIDEQKKVRKCWVHILSKEESKKSATAADFMLKVRNLVEEKKERIMDVGKEGAQYFFSELCKEEEWSKYRLKKESVKTPPPAETPPISTEKSITAETVVIQKMDESPASTTENREPSIEKIASLPKEKQTSPEHHVLDVTTKKYSEHNAPPVIEKSLEPQQKNVPSSNDTKNPEEPVLVDDHSSKSVLKEKELVEIEAKTEAQPIKPENKTVILQQKNVVIDDKKAQEAVVLEQEKAYLDTKQTQPEKLSEEILAPKEVSSNALIVDVPKEKIHSATINETSILVEKQESIKDKSGPSAQKSVEKNKKTQAISTPKAIDNDELIEAEMHNTRRDIVEHSSSFAHEEELFDDSLHVTPPSGQSSGFHKIEGNFDGEDDFILDNKVYEEQLAFQQAQRRSMLKKIGIGLGIAIVASGITIRIVSMTNKTSQVPYQSIYPNGTNGTADGSSAAKPSTLQTPPPATVTSQPAIPPVVIRDEQTRPPTPSIPSQANRVQPHAISSVHQPSSPSAPSPENHKPPAQPTQANAVVPVPTDVQQKAELPIAAVEPPKEAPPPQPPVAAKPTEVIPVEVAPRQDSPPSTTPTVPVTVEPPAEPKKNPPPEPAAPVPDTKPDEPAPTPAKEPSPPTDTSAGDGK